MEDLLKVNYHQKLFHLVQRSFASRGFFETISWSFTNSKFNQYYSDQSIKITNPISADLDVLRSSNFVNLILQAKLNLDRSNLNLQMFEVGPVFKEDLTQETIASGILVGKKTGEGVFGVSFKLKGPPKNIKTTVNPIKTLTPRFITRTLEKIKKTN